MNTYHEYICSFHNHYKYIERGPGHKEHGSHQKQQDICPSSSVGVADHSRGGVVLQDCLGGGLKDEVDLEICKHHYGGGDDVLQDDA